MSFLDDVAHVFQLERDLRNEDQIRSAGYARLHGDPPGVTSHDLYNDDPVVRLGRGVESIDGLSRDVDGRVEAEREIRAVDGVVDGLGHPHNGQALPVEFVRDTERVFPADHYQAVEFLLLDGLLDRLAPAVDPVGIRARRSENGPTSGEDARDLREPEGHLVVFDDTRPTVAEPYDLSPILPHGAPHDRPYDRIQPGAVSAAGEDRNLHLHLRFVLDSRQTRVPRLNTEF